MFVEKCQEEIELLEMTERLIMNNFVVWEVPSIQIREYCQKKEILASIFRIHGLEELTIQDKIKLITFSQFVQVPDIPEKDLELLVVFEILMHLDFNGLFDNIQGS